MFQETSLALRAGELRRPNGVKARGNCRARCEEASAAWPWRAVGDSQDGAARTPRAVGRPVGSKKPKEASRRVWDCGIRGGRERIGMGGESLAWSGLACVSSEGGVCVCSCAGQHAPARGRDLGGSECGWTGSRVGAPPGAKARERDQGQRGLRVPVCVCVCQALRLSTGAAWHPQECGFSQLPRPPPVPKGGGRQEKGGERGRNPPSPTRASHKGQFISPFTGGPGRRTGHQRVIQACQQACPSASWAL